MPVIALERKSVKSKSILTVLAVTAAVLLPQLFHAVGAVSGTGGLLGAAFLPMHLPVLIAGLLGGPVVGLLAGAASPLISFGLSGMPAAALLPFMMVELAGYGITGGLLAKTKMPVFCKLLIAQLAGRVLRAAAVLLAVYGFGSRTIMVSSIWTTVTAGLPGILLQWALIPLLLYRLGGLTQKIMTDLERACVLLKQGTATCVLCQGEATYTSEKRGVAPLLEWLEAGVDLRGFSAADKIVGRAAALLFALAGVRSVYAPVMSEGALEAFAAHGIAVRCDQTVSHIINRAGTGSCPMELAVAGIDDPQKARAAILQKLAQLQQGSQMLP